MDQQNNAQVPDQQQQQAQQQQQVQQQQPAQQQQQVQQQQHIQPPVVNPVVPPAGQVPIVQAQVH
jgi:hypothetical protein